MKRESLVRVAQPHSGSSPATSFRQAGKPSGEQDSQYLKMEVGFPFKGYNSAFNLVACTVNGANQEH